MSASPISGAPGVLTIDLGALADNWRLLARRAAPARMRGRHQGRRLRSGASRSSRTALYRAGCRTFFVAHLSEGRRARAVLPQADARLYVLNGLQSGADPQADYAALRLAPAIGCAEELGALGGLRRDASRAAARARCISTPA